MSQHELHIVVFEILFLDFSNHAFKVDDHDHLVLVALPTAEVKSTTFELENSLRVRLQTV